MITLASRWFRVVLAMVGLACALPGGARAATGNGLLYVLNDNPSGNQIFGFSVTENTGQLVALPGFPVATGGNGDSLTVSERLAEDRTNNRLYAINGGSNTLSAFSIDPATGALTALPFSPLALGTGNFVCVSVHPSGSPVVVGNLVGSVSSIQISATAATPAAGSPFPAVVPFSTSFSQSGAFVYIGNGGGGTTYTGFSVNAATGVLTPLAGSPFDSGAAAPITFATDPSGRLFLASFNSNQVRVFATNAGGIPSAATANPFTSGLSEAVQSVLHPNGFYMVADRAGNRVGVYQIAGSGTATTLTAVAGSPFAAGGTFTDALALTQNGAFLFAANGSTRNLTTYEVNSTTGALSNAITQPANTLGAAGGLTGMAYLPPPTGSLLYVLNGTATANQIFAYSVNETTGQLTPIYGFPVGTGGTGNFADCSQLAIDHANGRLYAANSTSKSISAFSINPKTGFLTALPFSPIGLAGTISPTGIAVHPSGSPIVVGDLTNNTIQSFSITATTATAAAGSPYVTGITQSFSLAFSQDGNFIYAGGTSSTFAGFGVNSSNGVLTALAGSPFASGSIPLAFATDAAGRLFMTDYSAGKVRAFTTSAGIPSPVAGNPFSSGLGGACAIGLLHPSGYYLVSDRNGNRIGVFQIAGSGSATTLAPVGGSPFASGGTSTQQMALNANGSLLFAANGNTRNVTSFLFNSSTGALVPLGTQPVDAAGGAGGFLSGMVYVAQPAPISFGSGPTATPNPAGVGQTITFTSAATGGFGTLTYSWNFADGSPAAPGASVTHAYAVAGTYMASVTATDILGSSTTVNVAVIVNGPVVGTGPDSDGDGFSDSFETAVGTNPNDATDTPTGIIATASAVQTLSITKVAIKLNFAKPTLNDSISFSGAVIVPEGFHPAVSNVFIDVGGVTKKFLLDQTGAAVSADKKDSIKIGIKSSKGVVSLQTAKYTLTFKNGSFAASLADEGLTSTTVKNSAKQVLFTLIFNNTVMQKLKTVSYTATAGKSGMAK